VSSNEKNINVYDHIIHGGYCHCLGSDFSIVQFSIPSSKNPSLSSDAIGTISGEIVSISVPHNADIAGLVAEFTPSSEKIKILLNGVEQKSGESKIDYTAPVVFTLSDGNKEIKNYTITVNRAPSNEKSFLSYSLNGTAGVIDDSAGTISVGLPPRTALASLVASFSSNGKSIQIGGMEQKSGVTVNDFTNPQTYTIIAEDGSQKQYTVTARALPAPWKDITSFSFLKEHNSNLPGDVSGVIAGNTITVEIPYGSSRENLIASFESSGVSVAIGSVVQESGITVNTCTSPLTYRVTAEDNSQVDYSVTVSVAKSDAKSITSFTLDGEHGTIDETARIIRVNFSSTKNLNGLVATFATSGVVVRVNGVDQVSGTTANDFTGPVSYDVAAENGTVNSYQVTAVKKEDIAGLWNFEYPSDGSYHVFEAVQAPGPTGNALQFDGYNDYLRVPDSDVLTLGAAGTVEAVVWINAYTPFAGIVHKGVNTDFSDEAYSLQFWTPDGLLRFSIFNDAGVYTFVDSPGVLNIGQWYHLVGVWDTSRLVMYINGVEAAATPNTAGAVRNTDGDLVIGAQLTDAYINSTWRNLGFSGIIDKVQIYNRALTAEEILASYNSIFATGGQAMAAYLLSAVTSRGFVLIVILGIVAGLLVWIYMRNRREATNKQ